MYLSMKLTILRNSKSLIFNDDIVYYEYFNVIIHIAKIIFNNIIKFFFNFVNEN